MLFPDRQENPLSKIRKVAQAVKDGEYQSVRHAIFEWDADDLLDVAVAYGDDLVRGLTRSATLDAERSYMPAPRDRRPFRERLDPVTRAKHDAKMDEIDQRLNLRLRDIISDFESALRVTWDRELLDSEFALPDGSVTTWGEATVPQHQERCDMHTRNAQSGIEGAARHQRAIKDLTITSTATLNELFPDGQRMPDHKRKGKGK